MNKKVHITKSDTGALEHDAAHMEKKLALLRDMIQLEEQAANKGNIWKSGGTKKPIRKGYIDEVSPKAKKPPVGAAPPPAGSPL